MTRTHQATASVAAAREQAPGPSASGKLASGAVCVVTGASKGVGEQAEGGGTTLCCAHTRLGSAAANVKRRLLPPN